MVVQRISISLLLTAVVFLHGAVDVRSYTCFAPFRVTKAVREAEKRCWRSNIALADRVSCLSRTSLKNGESNDDISASGDEASEGVAQEENELEQEEAVEDPEVKALKDEIASLESTLRSKRAEASQIEEKADEYTKTGYYRKCAEMDNFRKRRDLAFQNSKYVSRASVMQKFLPVMDELNALGEQYEEDAFGRGYDALRKDFNNVMSNKLDLEDYDVQIGEALNRFREAVVGYEYSNEVAKGHVLQQVSSGLEVKGNIVRFAECIVSKGSETDEKKLEDENASDSDNESDNAAPET